MSAINPEDIVPIVRCDRCGRIKCETCGGTGDILDHASFPREPVMGVACPDCEDGWQKADACPDCSGDGYYRRRADSLRGFCGTCGATGKMRGTDPAILCPKCEHLRDEAEAALEPDVRSVAQDFRDSIKDALAEETLAEEAERN